MKKAITFILLFVILLLSAVGCADHKKDPPVEESVSVSGETEETLDSSDVPAENDTEEVHQTNASSKQSVTGAVSKTESKSTTVSQGKTDSSDKTQPANSTETNSSNQTNSETEPSSSSVTGDGGVDLPIDLFD